MKPLRKKLKVIVEKTRTGFSAYVDGLPIITTAPSIPVLQKNMLEAVNLYFEDEGYEVDTNKLVLEMDLKQFFRYYRVLNAKYLAEKIGMNPTLLSQYVQGKKKPTARQRERIVAGIQQIGKELSTLAISDNS